MSKVSNKADTKKVTTQTDDQSTKTGKPGRVNPLTENAYAHSHIRSLFQHGNQLHTRDKLLLNSALLSGVSQCASLFTVYLAGIAQRNMVEGDGKKKKPRSTLSYEDVVSAAYDINIPAILDTVLAQAALLDEKKEEKSAQRKRAREEKKSVSTQGNEDGDDDDDEQEEESSSSEEVVVEKAKKEKKDKKSHDDLTKDGKPSKRQRQK